MPLHSTAIENVNRFELATILAALRLLQATPALPPEIREIAIDCGDFEPLDGEQIDDLCARINAASEYPWRDVTDDDTETVALETRVAGLFEQTEKEVAEEERAGEAIDMQMRVRLYSAEGV